MFEAVIPYAGHIRNTTYDYVPLKLAALSLPSQDSPDDILDPEDVQNVYGG